MSDAGDLLARLALIDRLLVDVDVDENETPVLKATYELQPVRTVISEMPLTYHEPPAFLTRSGSAGHLERIYTFTKVLLVATATLRRRDTAGENDERTIEQLNQADTLTMRLLTHYDQHPGLRVPGEDDVPCIMNDYAVLMRSEGADVITRYDGESFYGAIIQFDILTVPQVWG